MSFLFLLLLVMFQAITETNGLVAQESDAFESSTTSDSQQMIAQQPMHEELIAMREQIVKAVNSKDIEGLLAHVHPNVVVVWQNAEISRGHDGVRKYYDEMLGAPNALLSSYTIEPSVQELTVLHGDDTGIAYGSVLCHFTFKSGVEFDLTGPWSATMVRHDGKWTIAAFHASAGLFDNPLLLAAKRSLVWGCVTCALAGILLGGVVAWFLKKRRAV